MTRTINDKVRDRLILLHGLITKPRIGFLVRKFGGMISEIQAYYLYHLAKKRPGVILDIGSHSGLSAVILSLSGNKVFAFEWFKGLSLASEFDPNFAGKEKNYITSKNTFLENIGKVSKRAEIELVEGDCTKTIPALINSKRLQSFSVAFIDLDLYHPTKETIESLLSISRGNEKIVIHDQAANGIQKAVEEIVRNHSVAIEREWPILTLNVLSKPKHG